MSEVDENVKRIQEADDEEARAIEAELLEQTDNRPHEGDPPQPEEEAE